jgi:hypothetical protein
MTTKRIKPPRRPMIIATPVARPPTAIELWYLECLRVLTRHLRRPPSIVEFATYCKRAVFPAYSALCSLEAKGVVRRNKDRRFEEVRS